MDQPDKLQALATKYKWLLGGLAALLVAPFTGYILYGLLGILGLIATAAVILTAGFMAPAFAFKLANLRMKAIMAEANANPIETLKNDYLFRTRQLQEADDGIEDFQTEIANYDDQMREFSKQYPDEVGNFKEISTAMHNGLVEMKQEQAEARKAVAELERQIDKAEAIYKMALAAERVTSFSKNTEAKVFADIKQKVAFDAVRSKLNKSFASLDRAMAKRTELSPAQFSSSAVPEGRKYKPQEQTQGQ